MRRRERKGVKGVSAVFCVYEGRFFGVVQVDILGVQKRRDDFVLLAKDVEKMVKDVPR